MKTLMISAILLQIGAFAELAWPRGIYVDANASASGTGTADAPYQTIAQAMEQAREIRKTDLSRIVIRVAPGTYNENFPIFVDVPNLALRGSTHLIEDDDDLPGNCGSDSAPSPCIEAGTETLITPKVPLPAPQKLLNLAPTKDNPVTHLADITISGFIFDGQGVTNGSGSSIFIDRVDNFLVDHNVIRGGLPGLLTRMSSGRIQSNFAYNNADGFVPSGGNEIYPARVELIANRSINGPTSMGVFALGAAAAKIVTDPKLAELQTVYDPALHPEQVPDKLTILVIGNDFSRNMFGFRFEEYIDGGGFYDTSGNQPLTASTTATVRSNLCRNNTEYGFLVEGAYAPRTNPREFTGTFTGSFENNDCSGTGRAGIFAGSFTNGQVTRNPANINTYKYLQNSQFNLRLDDASLSAGLDYDNPVLDPFDQQTPLNNQLTINGDTLTGTRVTCPSGFPCVSKPQIARVSAEPNRDAPPCNVLYYCDYIVTLEGTGFSQYAAVEVVTVNGGNMFGQYTGLPTSNTIQSLLTDAPPNVIYKNGGFLITVVNPGGVRSNPIQLWSSTDHPDS